MKTIRYIYLIVSIIIISGTAVFAQLGIIPKPSKMVELQGSFTIDKNTKIFLDWSNNDVKRVVDDFIASVKTPIGFEVKYSDRKPKSGCIRIISDRSILNIEGYLLKVNPEMVTISASSAAGVFYALQTLRQLLPPEIESPVTVEKKWQIPSIEIEDSPRFEYRGFMLDVARHFQPVEVLKRYIDLLSLYKINHFHLHLTDDQGWRIEIKKYPKLQEISAWRKESMVGHSEDKPRKYDGIRHGGFLYTGTIKGCCQICPGAFHYDYSRN